jgi:hypothetical protein
MDFALPIFFLIWMAPMAALAAFDFYSTGRIHAVTGISTGVMALAFVRVLFVQSEAWLVVGRALLRPLL